MLTGFVLQVTNNNWAVVFLSAAGISVGAVIIYAVNFDFFIILGSWGSNSIA
jgi:hypothetical protein